MAVEDRLISLLAAHTGLDENAIDLEDSLWIDEGGFLDVEAANTLLDEVEGEFGIDIDERDSGDVSTVGDLLRMVETLSNEERPGQFPK